MGFESGHLIRAVLKATRDDNYVDVTTLHYNLDNVAGELPNEPQSLADTLRDDVLSPYKALFTNNWTISPVELIDEKDPLDPTRSRSSWTSGTAGAGTRTSSGDYLHPAVCGVATLRTDRIGRRFTGRMFLPGGLLEGDINNLVFNGSIVGLWTTFLAAIPRQPDIVTGISSSSCNWCVYSRTQRTQDLDPYAESIASVVQRTKIHWLRSRGNPG